MKDSRRSFLKNMGALGGSSLLVGAPFLAQAGETELSNTTSSINMGSVEVNILQTTDVHCQIHPHDELFWENKQMVFRQTGGYAHLATYLKQEKKKPIPGFLIDTGDMFQGSELSVKTTGKAMSPLLDALNYDLYLPGNWEVVYYKAAMQKLLGGLQAPKVCANMYHDLGQGKRGELIFPPYYIWQINGIKIGFLGYTDPLVPLRQSPNYSKGIIYSKPEENMAFLVDVLRNQENCSAVLVIAHLGLSQQIHLANMPECEGVDYILGGDTHERVRKPIVCKYAKVVEPGAFGSFVGKLNLHFEGGKLVQDNYELVEITTSKYKADKAMVSLIQENEKQFADDIYTVIGYSKVPLYRYFVIENTIDTLVLNAIQYLMKDIDIVLSNGFRFCPPRTTADQTGNIPITNGYIFDMLPVDSIIRTGKVTGAQIMAWLEKELNNVFAADASDRFGGWVIKFTGMQVKFLAFGEKGKRVKEVLVGGKPLNAEATYSICACEREGDPEDVLCRIKNVANAKNTPFTLHQAMKNYLKANSPVEPKLQHNAMALDAPETLLTQVTGVDYQFR